MEIIEKTYLEIIKMNKGISLNANEEKLTVTVLSNITFNKIKDVLELPLKFNGINAEVNFGNYDNIIQDSISYSKSDTVIIHQELSNLSTKIIQNQIHFDEQTKIELINEYKTQIDLILQNLNQTRLIIYNQYSTINFFSELINNDFINSIAFELNKYLRKKSLSLSNLKICNIDQITSSLGIQNSLDYRSYSAFKDLYKTEWLQAYVNVIQHYIYSITGKIKKALILDCDNTLWKGILGEDGVEGISMDSSTKEGEPFYYVQNSIIQLAKKGILICLCSKNNEADVDEVIEKHSDFLIKNEYITSKKVNWNDKVTNIKEISSELNIGLDSFIFLDDSDFEVNLVKEKLPAVTTFQVPKNLSEYPSLFNKITNYFYRDNVTKEDIQKAEEYKKQAVRNQEKSTFNNIEDYIKSLEIKVKIFRNDLSHLPRMGQMAQKTNQFNFTTIRHTDNEIKNFINEHDYNVYCINVGDKFGDSGITGLIITKDYQDKSCELITFLMSCRIIGRNIEYAFLKHVINDCQKRNIDSFKAKYIKTKKNSQVSNFFETINMNVISETDEQKVYSTLIDNIKIKNVDYIRSINE